MGMIRKTAALAAGACLLIGLAACGGQTSAGGTGSGQGTSSSCESPSSVSFGDGMSFKEAWKTIELKCLSNGSGRLDDGGKVTVTITDTAFKGKQATAVKFTIKNDGDKALSDSSPEYPVPYMMFESSNAKNLKQLQAAAFYQSESAAKSFAENGDSSANSEGSGDKTIPAHSEKELWAVYSNHYIDLGADSDEIDPDQIAGVDIVVVGGSTSNGVYRTIKF
ncbi:hypothetical protein [Bifidobacterium platyrrhinorum]|uniref:DUF5067 domain-containing protein n=1 Tax=Bifidobacterium platyrrhinorum TaxID=2661628 RepID=A0A6L9SRV0_9BIFI|nr:hypothetical protein [Bifidobacterium platyrrhinorum]NEG55234.1 hypothetical protein [Bifidobacterium platyrrhinorum]